MRYGNDRRGNRGGFNRGGGNRDGSNFRGANGFNRGPREMHKTVCAECKNECEVPFKPSGDKPVYCRECFQKHRQ